MKIQAKKISMSQTWKDDSVAPVTVLRVEDNGEKALVDIKEGDLVKVSGKSKGKGFQGVVKRWGFKGAPASHGTKHNLRAPGSIGATGPQRVIPGKKMAGRMGGNRVTVKNLEVQEIRPKEKLILVKGAVPGMRGNKVEIQVMKI